MYWDRNGRWYHLLSNGRSFPTLEAAERDYQLQRPVGWADTPIGAFTKTGGKDAVPSGRHMRAGRSKN